MNQTKIEWTDFSWNPITGCLHKCPFCYARAIYHRFGRSFKPTFLPDRLRQPLKIKKPSKIFVGSVTDICGDWVPHKWIDSVLVIVKECPQHQFQFLTKNPKRYQERMWPLNSWLGASTIDQTAFDIAINFLDELPNLTFISCEPLYGPIKGILKSSLDWIIVGSQTGIKAFQPNSEWVKSIILDSRAKLIPVYLKPNLVWPESIKEFPSY